MYRGLLPAGGAALNRLFQRCCFSGWNQVRALCTSSKWGGGQKKLTVGAQTAAPARIAHQAASPNQAAAKRESVNSPSWHPPVVKKSRQPLVFFNSNNRETLPKDAVASAGPQEKKGLFGRGSSMKTERPSSRLVAMCCADKGSNVADLSVALRWDIQVKTVEEARKAAQFLLELGQDKSIRFAVDTETTGVDPTKQSPVGNGQVVCFSVYCGPQVDFARLQCETLLIHEEEGEEGEEGEEAAGSRTGTPTATDPDANKTARLWVDTAGDVGADVMEAFRGFFESSTHLKVFHNYSFDSHVLANHGISCQGFGGDTVHMARLWDTSRALRGGYKLSALCEELLGWGKTDMKKVFGKGALKKDGTEGKLLRLPDSLDLHTSEDPDVFNRWVAYSTFDTLCTWFLYVKLEAKLRQISWHPDPVLLHKQQAAAGWSLTRLKEKQEFKHPRAGTMMDFYVRVWRPFGQVLVDMERAGMYLDTAFLEQQTAKAEEFKELADQRFREWAAELCADGVEVNTNSSLQKRHLLYSSRRVLLTVPKPIKHKVSGQELKPGQEIELAWYDADRLVSEKRARDIPDPDNEPDMKTFTVKNTAGLVREGQTKPAATREIRLKGLRLKPIQYTATGMPSTASNVIQALAGKPFKDPPEYGKAFEDLGGTEEARKVCEALGHLLEAEATEKLLNTFLRPLPQMVDVESRIHSSVNLNTETGRLSSQRPNLQNQPALEKDRYQVRKAFKPAPGSKFIVADYGQLELRIMAHMTRCKSMIEALAAGGDFHSRTAIDMYAHIREAVEKGEVLLEPSGDKGVLPLVKDKFANERKSAKIVNFSIAYGKTKKGLAVDLSVTPEEAQETINKWYDARKEVKEWQDRSKQIAASEGYTATLLGRRRVLTDINSKDSSSRGHAQRGAINTPIQGGAADVVVMAMLKIARSEAIRELGWRMVMQIHDELILEGPTETAEQAFPLVKQCMEHPFENPMLVKLPVDGGICDSWFEGK